MWNYKVENRVCDKYNFGSIDEIELFLSNLFSTLNQTREYNIFIHQINDYCDNVERRVGTDAIKSKMKKIMNSGFKISEYSTLSGTARLIGSTKNLDLTKIVGYDYYGQLKCKALCIVAIPKSVRIQGTEVEYSSFNGEDAWSFPDELTAEYIKHCRVKPELHHYKSSLFDAIKRYHELPNCYMLGLMRVEESESKFRYYDPKTHLSLKSLQEQTEHDKLVESQVVELYNKYKTKDLKTVIVESYKEDQVYYDYKNDFDI